MALFTPAGGNHPLPKLTYVTTAETLTKLGVTAAELRQSLPHDSLRILALPLDRVGPAQLKAAIQGQVAAEVPTDTAGVVLLGDYDTLPSLPFTAISQDLAASLATENATEKQKIDADGWTVWTDDFYGDIDHDGFPDVPVSRVPGAALWRALEAQGAAVSPPRRRGGIRARDFVFAQTIYDVDVDGDAAETMFVSPPPQNNPTWPARKHMKADRLYLALHGTETSPHELLGGNGASLTMNLVPQETGAVVFCGACWGALVVNQTAWRAVNDSIAVQDLTPRIVQPLNGPALQDRSIALTFIARGTTAFVGFTALHYVPTQDSVIDSGGALHRLFWRRLRALGAPPQPAKALFEAKSQYLARTAQRVGREDDATKAVALKTFWSATCLGLGW